MKEFTEEELALYNGKNGKPAYVAYKGKVYDVSASFLWKDGNHQVLHEAGVDLTAAMKQAPHGEEALDKFPVIGILRNRGMPSASS
ncbi:MAG: cytochrome b5 domain-containing protein [Candidatus Bathyarchaeia archaeon]|jgi:predicted heme/steroid binding protein|nr:cytochrome B5 [Candidatus Bathyarchaeota archaeon A05DMB-4]MDH7596042.1 cytochrome b5 domain-containing protein [Candidatus Bathyarchaeota archaeon]